MAGSEPSGTVSTGVIDGSTYFRVRVNGDPHAIPAIRAYAKSCRKTHPKLAEELIKLAQDAKRKRIK